MAAISDMADDDVASLVRDACGSVDRAIEQAEAKRDRWVGIYMSMPDCASWKNGVVHESIIRLGASEYGGWDCRWIDSEKCDKSDQCSDDPDDESQD